ncbi:amino acid permease [Pseudohongiella nitratireducens]|uniref:Amino acid permease n=1 Tax=Pseudohongiella nitratireducens TaxID=1768907 RepID=A0A917GQX1_9GAMM|nr:amino acid permease [Pseudohongiella nitratireducens]MDF1624144.1 amino acid permease [Pseudohongiella nitratireducens]GGG54193.1 amino acid permease [Pseudohongiella nitratireducens]
MPPSKSAQNSNRGYDSKTATAVVVANMIGTGVFTSLGFQLVDIRSVFALLMLWFVGGIAALCGALTYAELTSRLPRSGGEYAFLSRIYHPALGFVSGWVSLTVGFAAPTALAAMTFAAYLGSATEHVVEINRMAAALTLVIIATFVHGRSHQASGRMQDWFTLIKVALIIIFILLVVMTVTANGTAQPLQWLPSGRDDDTLLSPAFAVSLIYVSYAYAGWNAATYITNEVRDPTRTVPKVLVIGTCIVMLLYLALNATFLFAVPMDDMEGRIEIGVIVAQYTFGQTGGLVMGATLSLLLISTVSAMTIAGPRVLQVMGEDFRLFRRLSETRDNGVPRFAIYAQGALTVIFIVTSTFDAILVFSGFLLGLSSLATVLGIFVLRYREQKAQHGQRHSGYRTWLYPLPPLIYSAIVIWTLGFIAVTRPVEAFAAAAILLLGLLAYWATEHFSRPD